jgi:hypothetical protein
MICGIWPRFLKRTGVLKKTGTEPVPNFVSTGRGLNFGRQKHQRLVCRHRTRPGLAASAPAPQRTCPNARPSRSMGTTRRQGLSRKPRSHAPCRPMPPHRKRQAALSSCDGAMRPIAPLPTRQAALLRLAGSSPLRCLALLDTPGAAHSGASNCFF